MQKMAVDKNQKKIPAKQAGIDMDSLLDAKYPKTTLNISTDDILDMQNI